ncbi:MAG TPA: class I SAM-dependent methyltransferase [Rubrivivax sp.]|nr:class I SAM-dependent methyltransferase [Rubrivivax sp.]
MLLNGEQPAAAPTAAPSRWLQRWIHLLPPGASVLDVACGSGRNLRWLAAQGFALTGVDRDEAALGPLRSLAEIVIADLEAGPWPFPGRRFDLVLVTHYLWRPLLPTLVDTVARGGFLIYETFAQGQETIGRPSRSDFLLRHGELLAACRDLHVVAYENGFVPGPPPRYLQRIVAAREPAPLPRHRLPEAPSAAGAAEPEG